MRTKVIIYLILCVIQLTQAQTNFFKTYKQPSHERAFSSVQTSDGDFIIASEKRVAGYNGINQGHIAKLSGAGEIVKEELFDPNDASRYCIITPYQYANASFLCIGSSDSVVGADTYSRMVFSGIDDELNILWEKRFSFQKNYIVVPWKMCRSNDTILYLMIENIKSNDNPGLQEYVSVTKYFLPFDSISNYTINNYSWAEDLIFRENLQQLDLYISPSRTIVKLDKDLNYISSTIFNNRFYGSIDLTSISDTSYLFSGTAIDNTSLLIGAIEFKNDIANDSIYFTPSFDTSFYAGGRENTIISGNNIFITGFYNVHAWWFPYNYNPSWVTITKLDMDLNMISTHFYGGDAQYCPFSIIATSDGGCFVTGYSYDYINNYPAGNQELDIFALKVNSDGLITDLPDHPEAKAHDAIVYPNPGRDNLTIQSGPQINDALFTLYDMQGHAVLNEKITSTQLRLYTSGLAAGVYPWQIVYKNKVIESGKWVKE